MAAGEGSGGNAFAALEKKTGGGESAQAGAAQPDRAIRRRVYALKQRRRLRYAVFALLLPPFAALTLLTVLEKHYLPWAVLALWAASLCLGLLRFLSVCALRLFLRRRLRCAAVPFKQAFRAVKRLLRRSVPARSAAEAEAADEKQAEHLQKTVNQDWFIFIICAVCLLDIAVFPVMNNWSAPAALLALQGVGFFILSDKMDMPETHELVDKLLNGGAGKMRGKE